MFWMRTGHDDHRKGVAMLVLTRRLNEAIQIGDDIVIHVLRINPHTVRIGIEAPRSLSIMRPELTPHELAADSEAGGSSEVTP